MKFYIMGIGTVIGNFLASLIHLKANIFIMTFCLITLPIWFYGLYKRKEAKRE